MANGYFRFKSNYINPFPIPEIKDLSLTRPFEILSDYLIILKNDKNIFKNEGISQEFVIESFEEVINFMTYELYFKKEMEEYNIEFISFAQRDFIDITTFDYASKIDTIKKVFYKIKERENKIRNNIILAKLELNDLIIPIEESIINENKKY